jgi:1-aminocyclopropane-1-carboxylate deaminase
MKSANQLISISHKNISLYLKREDQLHSLISGNKLRKLKYNLLEACRLELDTLLTFGGAFSNHIAAVAAAGKEHGFKTIGIIRGEELALKIDSNPTLLSAANFGMHLEFVTREAYSHKTDSKFLSGLEARFGRFYMLPEGGTNTLAIKGCEEILTAEDAGFDYICCAIGTGGTIAGLSNSASPNQMVLGFPALKGSFFDAEIEKLTPHINWKIIADYHFGGYGKITPELIGFINDFYDKNKILLDPVYTGKLLFGLTDLIKKGYFPEGAKILAIHTGGLQGIDGMNLRLKNKNLQLIKNG